MKARTLFTAVLASMSFICASAVLHGTPAQAQTGSTAGGDVAVIDVQYILKNHRGFEAATKRMEAEFEAASDSLEADKKRIIELQKGLSKYNPGTAEYRRLDEQVTQEQAKWNVEASSHRKELQIRQAAILSNVYLEITSVVKQYCIQNNIGIVMQFNGEPIDPNKTFETANAIRRQLLYVAPNRDITPHILGRINQDTAVRNDIPGRQGPIR